MKRLLLTYLLFKCFTITAQTSSPIPGKVEAEDYVSMNSIGTEQTADTGGGLNVGWINDGSWMDYQVNVASAGYYTFKFRIANAYSAEATLALKSSGGTTLGQIPVPQTGGWQGWQTISLVTYLPSGNQNLRVYAEKGGFNFNWFEGIGSKTISGRLEAENFDAMHEVKTEPTGDVDGDLNVGYIDDGDWLDYNVSLPSAGKYTLNFRVANSYGQGMIQIKNAATEVLGQLDIPQTGGWQSWTTISTEVTLPQGSQQIRIFAQTGAFNFNWMEFIPDPSIQIIGTVLPGKVEAENFDAMNNIGTEPTSDTDGGMNAGWIMDDSWLDYKVHVSSAGYYTMGFRIANGYSPEAALVLKKNDGTVLGRIVLPQTGGMQGWKTVNMIALLPAGNQTLRVYAEKGGFNFNWFDAKISRPVPAKIEAETFDVAGDVRTDETDDGGPGTTVSYIDDGDWMDYNINVATAGTYTVNFRVANSYGNGNVEIKTTDGTVVGRVDVPQTGGWQNWVTIHTTATLSAGSQVLRIYANRGAFNLNWLEFVFGSVQGQSVITFGELPSRQSGSGSFTLIASSNNTETPVIFSSGNPGVVSVSNQNGTWQATILSAGQAEITASQAENNNFLAAENVTRTQTVTGGESNPAPTLGAKIPIDPKRWYQLTNAANSLEGFFDGGTQIDVNTGYGKVINNYEAYYPLKDGEQITLESIRFFDYTGSTQDNPMVISIITDQWQRIPIATFTGEVYNGWVGPYPDRHLTGDGQFKLDAPITNARYLVMTMPNTLPTEIEFYGSYTPPTTSPVAARTKNIKLKDLFGINGYEWNFQDGAHSESLVEAKVIAAKSFTGLRHYMDWEKLESTEGVFSYNPTLSGSWNYDLIYERCKQENIEVLACLKTLPNWMQNTYPADQRDAENVPVRYGKDFADPHSYLEQARVAFQYAARYGSNAGVDPSLLSVSTTPRWTGDYANTIRIGLNLIKYIECDNERDKWWKGRKGYQTAREYAANLSAFYDGHKNTMGPAIGIKNADPNMKVVIAGLVTGPDFVKGMVDWCREFRGYNADGSVNLCWDIVNFHLYTDNASSNQSGTSTRGAAPEVTNAAELLQNFVKVAQEYSNDLPIWITEAGYDINESSPIKTISIGNKSPELVQGDWILRTSLLSARSGIEKLFFFQMYDDNPLAGMFGSSGLINDDQTRRPAADYFYQANKLFGEYAYRETLHNDPIVDRYEYNGRSMFILTVPDEVGRTAEYTVNLGENGTAKIYTPKAGSDNMDVQEVPIVDGKVTVTAGETPIFVQAASTSASRIASTELLSPVFSEETLEEEVVLYPNPTIDYLTINVMNQRAESVDVTIFEMNSGALHKKTSIVKNGRKLSHKLNLNHLPAGIYIMELKQGEVRTFHKIAKVN